jgi:hypothetical protein
MTNLSLAAHHRDWLVMKLQNFAFDHPAEEHTAQEVIGILSAAPNPDDGCAKVVRVNAWNQRAEPRVRSFVREVKPAPGISQWSESSPTDKHLFEDHETVGIYLGDGKVLAVPPKARTE